MRNEAIPLLGFVSLEATRFVVLALRTDCQSLGGGGDVCAHTPELCDLGASIENIFWHLNQSMASGMAVPGTQ